VHVICGGGGAPLVQNQEAFYLAAHRKVHHYLRIEADREQLTGTAIDIDGVVFDRFALQKPGLTGFREEVAFLAQAEPQKPAAERKPESGSRPRATAALSAGSGPVSDSQPTTTIPEENVALWRTLKGLLNTSGRLQVPPKESQSETWLMSLPWVLRVPACPVPVRLEVEIKLDPIDAEFWKLTPDVDRFEWNAKKTDRVFWLQPRNVDALKREIPPRVLVRMESPFGTIVQGGRLGVTFVRDGKPTRRDRM
jgi:hypothetical protein